MKTVKIGLLGLGTVGGGVYKLIERQEGDGQQDRSRCGDC